MGMPPLDPHISFQGPSVSAASDITALIQKQREVGREQAAEATKSHNPY